LSMKDEIYTAFEIDSKRIILFQTLKITVQIELK